MKNKEIENLAINTVRLLAADGVQKAKSGHPGMPMGCAAIGFLLYSKVMKHNPDNSKWWNRDRFVLSAGHGSMLLYSLLHLSGYKVTMDDLKNFRQWGSITPGHPEFGMTDGVETTTGPLGQGFANAVGMSVAKHFMAATFNKESYKLFDHYIYAIVSDGDLMEGITHEAASYAGHNKLSDLIFFYDNNYISIDGSLNLAMSENVAARFEGYGWQVLHVKDGNDLEALENAVEEAKKDSDKPTIIITDTTIGYGSPNKQGTSASHGAPLGDDELKLTKKNLGFLEESSFYIPNEVSELFDAVPENGQKLNGEWDILFDNYSKEFPQEAELLKNIMNGNFGEEWKEALPKFDDYSKAMATRGASGNVLNAIAEKIPTLLGGSADLAPSNNTYLKDYEPFSPEDYSGRNFHFGVREHAMGSIMNGMAMYGGLIPYGGTFLVFSDYLRPVIRIAALSHVRPIYVFTHDSIGLGEDGPTHQPVEHISSLRTIPGLTLIRPADANETAEAWKYAIEQKDGPVALILTRQNLPVYDRKKYSPAAELSRGAYAMNEVENPDILLLASGSELEVAMNAAEELTKDNIAARVISFPSWEIFDKQDSEYKENLMPKNVTARIAIEAGVGQGWEKYLTPDSRLISIEKYGASAPYKTLYEQYGITAENVVKNAKEIL